MEVREITIPIEDQPEFVNCLNIPVPFVGVGLHYKYFSQVSDEEAVHLLKNANPMKEVS